MAFPVQDIAAVYALDLVPKVVILARHTLGLYTDRPYREYRLFRSACAVKPIESSTQLNLFPEDE